MSDVSLSIAGRPQVVKARFERRNPLTQEVATVAAAATPDQAAAAASAAAAALPAWAALGPTVRRARLMAAAAALEAKAADFVAAMMAETGATEGWARFNLALAAGMVREAAALTTQIGGEVIPSDKPGCIAMALREPAGVVLGIAPWNAPIILGVRAIAVPLACGNTVVLKASEQCPRTHALIVECFIEGGLADGVVNLITNAPEDAGAVVGALIDHPAVRRINFTGSTAVGRVVARRAAENLKPVLLELGGKAPLLVLDDADLDEAVKAAAFGAFMNQGQICMSTERIIVVDAVADAFVERFRAKVATLKVGDPRQGGAALGAVIDARTVSHLDGLVEDAIRLGASEVAGGQAVGVLGPAAGAGPGDAGDAPVSRGELRPDRGNRAGARRGARNRARQRHGIRAQRQRVHARHRARPARGAADPVGHLPHQRPDGARRTADAVRWREGVRLRPVRRPRRHRRLHRTPLDHDRHAARPLPDLNALSPSRKHRR